jgi:hypothetical protein
MQGQIQLYSNDTIVGPCPYPAGSAEKILWLGERWNRFALERYNNKDDHMCPEIMHNEDDFQESRPVTRSTLPQVQYSMKVSRFSIQDLGFLPD